MIKKIQTVTIKKKSDKTQSTMSDVRAFYPPIVGRSFIMWKDNGAKRVVTSAVLRSLEFSGSVYIETENTVLSFMI